MSPILKTLNDLSYVIECAAIDYMGEGKAELSQLCDNIEGNIAYAFEGRQQELPLLRDALACYRTGDRFGGGSKLGRVSRSLWRMYDGNRVATS